MPLRLIAVSFLLVLAACGGTDEPAVDAAPSATATVADERAATDMEVAVHAIGLEVPWDIAFLPDKSALVTERPGRIRHVSLSGDVDEEPVATVDVQAEGEGGLMGLALDPEFGQQPFAYVMATAGGEVRVLRMRWKGSRLTEQTTILEGITAGSIHDSGRLRFGPDGALYVVTGDAGNGDLAQDPSSLNGKVLVLEPEQYRGDAPADPTAISMGHRNPQGLDWQPETDQLFVTEHGPSGFDGPSCCDELNAVERSGNYEWPAFGADQERAPAKLWQDTIAPSGMAFAKTPGSAWTGNILVAALKGTSLRRLTLDGTRVTDEEVLLDGEYGRLRAVVEAPDGALWVTTSNLDGYGERTSEEDDRILRVVPPSA